MMAIIDGATRTGTLRRRLVSLSYRRAQQPDGGPRVWGSVQRQYSHAFPCDSSLSLGRRHANDATRAGDLRSTEFRDDRSGAGQVPGQERLRAPAIRSLDGLSLVLLVILELHEYLYVI